MTCALGNGETRALKSHCLCVSLLLHDLNPDASVTYFTWLPSTSLQLWSLTAWVQILTFLLPNYQKLAKLFHFSVFQFSYRRKWDSRSYFKEQF